MPNLKQVQVLKAFPVSNDGIEIRHLKANTTDSIPAELFDGLKDGGYVADVAAPAPAPGPEEKKTGEGEGGGDGADVQGKKGRGK